MTLAVAIVRQPSLELYPVLPATSEVALLPVVRVEPCACGEFIRLLAGDGMTATVGRHNDRPAHRAWRERSG